MAMRSAVAVDYEYQPSGGDISNRLLQDAPSGAYEMRIEPSRSLLGAMSLGTHLILTAPAMAAAMPHFGTSPMVEDRRETVTVAANPRSVDLGSSYRQMVVQSFGQQAKEAMAALSLTKSQLAGVLRVSRPTIYEWLSGKDANPANAARLTAVLRMLARAGITSEAPLNTRFVRHAIDEKNASLLDLLSADELDEKTIEDMLREAATLGNEAESRRIGRENRLRALGYEDQSPEQRRDNLNHTVAMLEWPK
jgi:transcriptional regulator with XRE-family HTH domain